METLSKYFQALAQPVMAKHGFAQADILSQWAVIAGTDIASLCSPERITRPRSGDGGTLVVRADAGRALELQYQIPAMLERVNGYFGYRAIAAIKLVQDGRVRTPKPHPRKLDAGPVAARISGIEDERLKSALGLLGAGVAARASHNPQAK